MKKLRGKTSVQNSHIQRWEWSEIPTVSIQSYFHGKLCMHTYLCTCLGKGARIYAWPTLQCQTDKSKQFSGSQTLHIWNRIKVMLWIWASDVIDNSISPTPKVLFSSFCKISLNYSQKHVYWKMSLLNNDPISEPTQEQLSALKPHARSRWRPSGIHRSLR